MNQNTIYISDQRVLDQVQSSTKIKKNCEVFENMKSLIR
jgi:hypothetical protein